jgi:uncharacterized protein
MAKAKRKRRSYSVRNSPIHGRGVFALTRIPRGTRIVEYKGEIITDDEADRRYAHLHEHSPHTMLFSLENNLVIDATRRGNSGRWINHSCTPNCQVEEEGTKIFIDACRDIRPGEELTYDYNLQLGEPHTRAAQRAHACFCGTRRCRGTMLGEKI